MSQATATAHEQYRYYHNPVVYDPADDGPEVQIIKVEKFLQTMYRLDDELNSGG